MWPPLEERYYKQRLSQSTNTDCQTTPFSLSVLGTRCSVSDIEWELNVCQMSLWDPPETTLQIYLFNQTLCQAQATQRHHLSEWVKVAQLCLTLCDPMHYIVHGILQARILEWVAIPFSRGSSQPRDQTQVSHIVGGFFTSWAIREGHCVHTHWKAWGSWVCPGGPVVKTLLPMQGAQFQSLVEDLRSCMPHSVAKKKKIFF